MQYTGGVMILANLCQQMGEKALDRIADNVLPKRRNGKILAFYLVVRQYFC